MNNGSRTDAFSQNVSMHGILVSTASAIQEGIEVEVMIKLPTGENFRTLCLEASGKVVRLEQRESGTFALAVSSGRPFRFTSVH